MGVEVKGAGDGVVIADRGCNDCNYGCIERHHYYTGLNLPKTKMIEKECI